jgi:hypothetical protein
MASDFQYGILKLFMEKETAYDEWIKKRPIVC